MILDAGATTPIEYLEDKGGCYTTARKVCSNNLAELIAWATEQELGKYGLEAIAVAVIGKAMKKIG